MLEPGAKLSGEEVEADNLIEDFCNQPLNNEELTLTESSGGETECVRNESPIERSFEVLSSSMDKIPAMDSPETESNKNGQQPASSNFEGERGEGRTRRNSIQELRKKSASFLSRLQATATNQSNESSNLPSSIANAFSSLTSSFTSNFNLSSSTNNENGNTTSQSLTIETASNSAKSSHNNVEATREAIFSVKASLERKNLINLTKLIVRDLITSSLVAGRTIDEGQNLIHLNNYFTLVYRTLKHGLKQNLLTNKSSSLWIALDDLSKYLKESTLISESVRSLAHTKTPDGKIKAWLRLAMMQKKLPEYFNELLANKSVLLKDIYHDYAFMLNDEAHVFAGLIIGVNVIDCNFFVKDDNFDLMDEIIDLCPYLRSANSFDENVQTVDQAGTGDQIDAIRDLTNILDQKNYLEEWNKRLETTISNLQSKVKKLEDQNSKLEMEAKLNEVRIQKFLSTSESKSKLGQDLQSDAMRGSMNALKFKEEAKHENAKEKNSPKPIPEEHSSPAQCISSSDEIINHEDESKQQEQQQQLLLSEIEKHKRKSEDKERDLSNLRERVSILETSYRGALEKIKSLERDLDVQTSMNTDKETTIKIYEKDIRDKQEQVESLRTSLNDAKKLNSDLSERLNDTSSKLKDRLKIVSALQESLDKWKLENKVIAARLQDKQQALVSTKQELDKSTKALVELKKYNEKINDELRKERECGQSCSVTVEAQYSKIAELEEKLEEFENELKDVRPLREQVKELKNQCKDYEQSLEEVGMQLRESRLEVENLKENSSVFLDSQWMDSKQVKHCALCQQSFSVTRRKHHCRLCGNVFCQTCSDNKMELASSAKPARVCDTCHSFLLAKFIKSASS